MAELRLSGRAASRDSLPGPLRSLERRGVHPRRRRSARRDAGLATAISVAIDQLANLARRADSDGADILAFQVAMLEDDSLFADALAAIGDGATADRAWRTALETQISRI